MEHHLLRLRIWLKKKGITREELAEATSYTRPYVSNVLNGKKPMYNTFIDTLKIALTEMLLISPDEVEKYLKPLRY